MASTYYILKAGIAPPDLASYPQPVRLMFWGWVVDLGLKAKDRELAQGLNAKGQPLPSVRPRTRRHRRSAMTPSGRGDPSAPYLMPGRGLSRTRSLLTGKAHADYAEFWWRYDAFTGDTWGKILAYHARRGEAYDVIGLSRRGVSTVASQAQRKWSQWKAGRLAPEVKVTAKAPPVTMKVVGRTDLEYTTFGIGASKAEVEKAAAEGRFSGLMTADEWKRYWRSKAAVPRLRDESATSYSVRRGASNVLLQHTWGDYQPKAGVLPMTPSQLTRAVEVLVDTIKTMPGLSPEQLSAVLGGPDQFDKAVGEAIRRRKLAIVKDASGNLVLKVIG